MKNADFDGVGGLRDGARHRGRGQGDARHCPPEIRFHYKAS